VFGSHGDTVIAVYFDASGRARNEVSLQNYEENSMRSFHMSRSILQSVSHFSIGLRDVLCVIDVSDVTLYFM